LTATIDEITELLF